MDFLDAYHLWADAHAFFDSTLIPSPTDRTDPLATQAAGWDRRLAEETPNGHLLRQNALFEALSGNGKLHLLHVTHALEEIEAGRECSTRRAAASSEASIARRSPRPTRASACTTWAPMS